MRSKFVNLGEVAPFECYLLVKQQDVPGYMAFEVLDLLDLEVLLQKALESIYYCYDVKLEIYKQNGGENNACIITDGRDTDSVIVWDSCDFYLILDE